MSITDDIMDELFGDTIIMLRKKIQVVMDKTPELTIEGMGQINHPNYKKDRAALLSDDNVVAFDAASFWIVELLEKRKTINKKYNSYGMKHLCEEFLDTYIANGVLIAAMLNQGYEWKQCINPVGLNPNVMFNVSLVNYQKKADALDIDAIEREVLDGMFQIDFNY